MKFTFYITLYTIIHTTISLQAMNRKIDQARHDRIASGLQAYLENFDRKHPLVAHPGIPIQPAPLPKTIDTAVPHTQASSSVQATSSDPKPVYKDIWPTDAPWTEDYIQMLSRLKKSLKKSKKAKPA